MIALFQKSTEKVSEKIVNFKVWLIGNGFDFTLVTEDPRKNPQGAKAQCEGSERIIICGDDRLVNAVVSATRFLGLPYGIILDGPGNSIAKSLNLNVFPDERQYIMAVKGNPAPVDTWVANGEILFISSLLFGKPAIAEKIHKEYLDCESERHNIRNRRASYRVICDDGQIETDMIVVAVQNTPGIGENMIAVPDAKSHDGLLDVVCIKKGGLFGGCDVISALREKGLAVQKRAVSFKTARVEIRCAFKESCVIDGEEYVLDYADIVPGDKIMVAFNH